ncbi:hypothetical protein QYF36_005510 [Acer negundo]|nr:hypothetical protein QYF36_005510 [Acer negundo]
MSRKEQYRSLPPRRGQIMIKIFKEMFESAAATPTTTTASRESQEDNDGQPQRPTSLNLAGGSATLVEQEQYRRLPPRRGQIMIKIFKEMFDSAAAATATTTAFGESQKDNGGQQQRTTSLNSAGGAATLVG